MANSEITTNVVVEHQMRIRYSHLAVGTIVVMLTRAFVLALADKIRPNLEILVDKVEATKIDSTSKES